MAVWHVADGGIDWRNRDRWRCNRSRRILESIRAMKKASLPVVMLPIKDSTTIKGKLITIVHHYFLLRVSMWLSVQLILADVFIGSGTGTRDERRRARTLDYLQKVRSKEAGTRANASRGTGCRFPNSNRLPANYQRMWRRLITTHRHEIYGVGPANIAFILA